MRKPIETSFLLVSIYASTGFIGNDAYKIVVSSLFFFLIG